jgi:ABC-type glycerol-3-phosphate transport system substrate-binding protein
MSKKILKIISNVLAIVLIVTLAACGDSKQQSLNDDEQQQSSAVSTQQTADAEEKKPMEINHLHLGDWVKPIFDVASKDFFDQTGIKVNIQYSPWDGAHDKYLTLINSNSLPDTGFIFQEWTGEFYERGVTIPVDKYISENFKNDILDNVKKNLTYKDNLMGVPFISSIRPYIYRADIFEENGIEPPQTFEDIVEIANKLNSPPDMYGYGLCAGRNKYTVEFFLEIFWAYGGKLLNDDETKVLFNSPEGVAALKIFKELSKTAPEGYLTSDGILPENVFQAGNIPQMIHGCWIIPPLKEKLPNAKIGIVPNIEGPTGGKASLYVIDSLSLFTKDEEKAKACMSWIEFFKSDEKYLGDSYRDFTLPPDLKSQNNWKFINENEIIKAILPCLEYGQSKPFTPMWSKIEDELSMAIAKVCTDKASPEQALAEAEKASNEALAAE